MKEYRSLSKKLMMAVIALMSIFTFINMTASVSANTGGGTGGSATGGMGTYLHAKGGQKSGGTTAAWKTFMNYAKNRGSDGTWSEATVTRFVDEAGERGLGGFGGMSLSQSCKNSEYIWWYGWSKTDKLFPKGYWFQKAGLTIHAPVQFSDDVSRHIWNRFKKMPNSGWGKNPSPIIVCSATIEPPKENITVEAKSKTVTYNGKQQSVSGIKSKTPKGIRAGHEVRATATASRTNVGESTSTVKSVKVVDTLNGNRDVTNQYNIKTRNGTLRVNKRNITVTAKSGEFIYNGKEHRVTGITTSRPSGIVSGHTVTASTLGKATNPTGKKGVPVRFTNTPKVMNGNTNVTRNYNVKTVNGKLIVAQAAPGPEAQCVPKSSQSVTSIIENGISVKERFFPDGAPEFIYSGLAGDTVVNDAGHLLENNLPKAGGIGEDGKKVGDKISKWNSWKDKFIKGGQGENNLRTVSVPLDSTMPLMDGGKDSYYNVLSKHGGVLDVSRVHNKAKVTMTPCQPQKRELELIPGTGNTKWGPWKNDGGLIIEEIDVYKDVSPDRYSYQIVGVNCNLEGLDELIDDLGNAVDKIHSYDKGAASGLLETKAEKGQNFPLGFPLGVEDHYTGSDGFYNDGTSCKDTLTPGDPGGPGLCIADKLTINNVSNDADNNIGNNPLFTEDGDDEGIPGEDGSLVFFRDNEDKVVRADVWYTDEIPDDVAKDFVTYPGKAAKETSATIFAGTPEIEITDVNIPGIGSIEAFNETIERAGHSNRVNVKSQWSSEDGKPYEIGLGWTYKADAIQNLAFSVDGHKIEETSEKTTEFDIRCQFMNDSSKSYQPDVPENPFLNPNLETIKWDKDNSIKVLFTRSVSDR